MVAQTKQSNDGLLKLMPPIITGVMLALMGYVVADIREMKDDIRHMREEISDIRISIKLKHDKSESHFPLPMNEQVFFVKSDANINTKRYAKRTK